MGADRRNWSIGMVCGRLLVVGGRKGDADRPPAGYVI
jgi:hypothetical protein